MLSKQEDELARRETLENDRKLLEAERRRIQIEGTTFHQFGQSQADEINQGRFAAIGVPTVTGATPIPKYPAAAAHQADPCGPEPVLGYDVNEMPALESPAVVVSAEPGAPVFEAPPSAVQANPPAGDVETGTGAPPFSDGDGVC
jgi:hypothetical protein